VGLGPWDLIDSSHSLEHIASADVPAVLDGIVQSLAPGGEALIIGPHWSFYGFSYYLCPDVRPAHLWNAKASCIGNYLIAAGLELVEYSDHAHDDCAWYVRLRKA
jgi:hypothetical protein